MMSLFFLILGLLANVLSEYPGKTTVDFGTILKNSTLLSQNKCCACSQTTKKPVTEVIRNTTYSQETQLFNLPDSIWPILYRLSVFIDFDLLKSSAKLKLCGNLTIHVIVKERTNFIFLNYGENMLFFRITVRNIDGNKAERNLTKDSILDPLLSIVKINLVSNLSVGGHYLIEFEKFESFHSDNQDAGIITRRFQNAQGEYESMLATQFQPESARVVFPCFDDPKFKSLFQLNITTNPEYTILANMPEVECQKILGFNDTTWKSCMFEPTPLIPVYNLAFAIVNFSHIAKTDAKGRMFRVWARHSEIEKTQFALDTTIQAIELLEDMLKIDFPLKKIDSLAIPNLKGFLGMEHYGLITYDEPVIIWSKKFPLSFSKNLCVSIICHEVSHQWFGNLVTMVSWQDLWLNEGFATFYSHKIAKLILKDDFYYSLELLSIFNYVRNFDDYFAISKVAISAPVVSYVESKFDYVSYKKGFILVHMLKKMLGKKSFDLSIIDYLNRNQYNSTTPADLWKSFNKHSNISISNVMDEWLNKVCYPIVKVRMHKNSSIIIKQNASIIFKVTRFKIKFKESITEIWKIPLHIIFGNTTFHTKEIFRTFDKASEIPILDGFNISNHWLILNTNYVSFFTTDYGDTMFNRLRHQLLVNHLVIPSMSRAQIMQDFYDVSRKYQRNNLGELLKLFVYLRNETDPVPLITAINLIDKLNGLFEFRSFYPSWHKYVSRILQPTFDKLVTDFQEDFRDPKSMYVILRRTAYNLACKLKLDQCFKITNKIIARWKNSSLMNSDYDLLHVALCSYIEMDNNGENWQYVYNSNKFISWDFINVKYYAMGCTRATWAIEKNIDIAFYVLKYSNNRDDFPHVSQIVTDHVPPDYLRGITPLSNLLMLSSIYNTPNSMHFLIRFRKDLISIILSYLHYPPQFPLQNSIVEHAVPTLSHYDFIINWFHPRNMSRNIILIEAHSNIKWILNNRDLEKQIQSIVM